MAVSAKNRMQNTIYETEKNMMAYLTVDWGYMNSHFLKLTKMLFFAEISSLDFPKNVVNTKYLKLLTILIELLPAIFSQCLSLIKYI